MREKSAFETITARGGFMDVQLGTGWSAPFTGYSWRAFGAFVALVDTWYSADESNRPRIEAAMREVLLTLQLSELPAARVAIYGVGNEQAMFRLWPTILPSNRRAL